MPISFNLEDLRKICDCKHYFETGLYDPQYDISTKKALSSGFERVFCIEICPHWVDAGKKVFQSEIESGRYTLILDDSSNMKYHLQRFPTVFCDRTVFFLDAHVDNTNIHQYKHKCPLFDELDAIASLDRKDHVILIDDLRIIKDSFPWGETDYGNIDFFEQILKKILSINDKYHFFTLKGHVENDVLLACVI